MKRKLLFLLSTSLILGIASCTANNEPEIDDKVDGDTHTDDHKNNEPSGEDQGEPENPGDDNTGEDNQGENPGEGGQGEDNTGENPGEGGENPGTDTPGEGGENPGTDTPGEEDDPVGVELDIVINNLSSELIDVSANKAKAKAGESLTITLTSRKMGFELKEVSFTNSVETAIEASKDGNEFTLAVPEDGVINVNATLRGISLKAYIFDEKGNFDDEIAMFDENNVADNRLSGPAYEEGVKYYNVVYGDTLKMKLQTNGYFEPLGVTVSGEEKTIDSDGYVTFKLEKESLNNKFFNITVLYKDNTPVVDEGSVSLAIEASEHISGSFFASDKETQITSANNYETVYLKTTSSSDDYSVKRVTLKYKSTETSSVSTRDVSFDETSQMYKFEVPYTYEGATITLKIEETSNVLLRDTQLSGEYFTAILSSASKHDFNFDASKILKIEDSGKLSYNNYEAYITSFDDSTVYTDGYSTLNYGKNLFYMNSDLKAPFTSYDVFAVKKVNPSDTIEDYSILGERFVVDSKAYFALQVNYKDNLYATAFIDFNEKIVEFNVDFEYLYGENMTSDKVLYNVKQDNQILYSFSYQNDGGINDRIYLDGVLGVYSDGEHSLVLPNEDSALLDGEKYVAVISGNSVTLTNGFREIVIELNVSNKAMTIVSDKEITNQELPAFAGKTFTGTSYDGQGDPNSTSIIFDNYSDDDIAGIIKYDGTYSWHHWFKFTGTYDFSTNELTVTFVEGGQYDKDAVGISIKFKVADTKLTGLGDINYFYKMRNYVYTCADFHL